jgi:hypothetical protein
MANSNVELGQKAKGLCELSGPDREREAGFQGRSGGGDDAAELLRGESSGIKDPSAGAAEGRQQS